MQHGWLLGFVMLFMLRLFAERWIKPRNAEPRPQPTGKLSLQLLALPFMVSGVADALWLWRHGLAHPMLYGLGLLLFLVGFAGRVVALRDLGRCYSLFINPAPTSDLQTTGLYSRVRHPLYACYLLEMLALALISPNLIALAALALVAFTTVVRIHAEEHALLQRYGTQYQDYMARTNSLLPRLIK